MQKLRIVVGGFLGLLPAGGVTWDYVQYPLGLRLMGHEVYYIEDTRLFPVYQQEGSEWNDATGCVSNLKKIMEYFQMEKRWAYRDEATGNCYGMSMTRVIEICRSADIFINLSCSTFMRDEYIKIPDRVLIDSDPMFTQIQYLSAQKFTTGSTSMRSLIDSHNHWFSFGENIGNDDCRIPDCGLNWATTRQPICISLWENQQKITSNRVPVFSSVLNWCAGKTLTYENEIWGQKNIEFSKILTVPTLFPEVDFTIVFNSGSGNDASAEKEDLIKKNWKVLAPEVAAKDWMLYSRFINESAAEFSVAKHTYVKSNSGWFSCRSACYLAAGKPVITQETGWSKYIPCSSGLFAFTDTEEAVQAVENLISNYDYHSAAARQIAFEYFDSTKVLTQLLNKI